MAEKFPEFKIYGDEGWGREVKSERLGQVKYGDGLRNIYNSSRINLDINRVVIKNGFTQRIFDVLACNAFLITSLKPVLDDYFQTDGPGKEIITFRNAEELIDLTKYYLSHDRERLEIASRGYRKVLSAHTYDHRIRAVFKC